MRRKGGANRGERCRGAACGRGYRYTRGREQHLRPGPEDLPELVGPPQPFPCHRCGAPAPAGEKCATCGEETCPF
jgi:hypothetical protein